MGKLIIFSIVFGYIATGCWDVLKAFYRTHPLAQPAFVYEHNKWISLFIALFWILYLRDAPNLLIVFGRFLFIAFGVFYLLSLIHPQIPYWLGGLIMGWEIWSVIFASRKPKGNGF